MCKTTDGPTWFLVIIATPSSPLPIAGSEQVAAICAGFSWTIRTTPYEIRRNVEKTEGEKNVPESLRPSWQVKETMKRVWECKQLKRAWGSV